jgi:tRNA(Arg) A34 adenosine deaminase TadA
MGVRYMILDDQSYIRMAIETASRARDNGNHPYGALLVDEDGKVLLDVENSVVSRGDSTAHAELNLLQQAASRYDSAVLANCTVYASTEPCPMCSGAIFWSNIQRVVYGLPAVKLYDLVGWSSEEVLNLSCQEIFEHGNKQIEVIGPVLEDEALSVHIGFWS